MDPQRHIFDLRVLKYWNTAIAVIVFSKLTTTKTSRVQVNLNIHHIVSRAVTRIVKHNVATAFDWLAHKNGIEQYLWYSTVRQRNNNITWKYKIKFNPYRAMASTNIRFFRMEKTSCCDGKKVDGPRANKSDELTRHKSTYVTIEIRIYVRIVENRNARFELII